MISSKSRLLGIPLLVSVIATSATYANASTTPNLLINGYAESQICTKDWTAPENFKKDVALFF